MTKRIIAILLSVIFVFSALAVGTFAADDEHKTYDPDFKDTITADDQAKYPDYELEIANPEERIDMVFLTGKRDMWDYPEQTATKSVLEYNLQFWKDEIINEYHALEADEDATAEEWGALYRKMKTPKNNDWTDESNYYDYWYEYRDEGKAVCDVNLVPSKTTDLAPGEEFTVDVYLTTNFYVGVIYTTFFYNNDVVDIMSCTEKFIGTADQDKEQPAELQMMHPMGERWGQNRTYLFEIPHYGDYTYGDSTHRGDMRDVEWPASLTSQEGYKDKYEAYSICFNIDDVTKTCPAIKFDNEILVSLKFKVKDDAAPGSTGTIFVPTDSNWTMNKLDLYDYYPSEYGYDIIPCWEFFRVDPDTETADTYASGYDTQYDQSITCTPGVITVAGSQEPDPDPADYDAFDAEYALFNSADSVLYTKASWAAYASAYTAVSSLSRELTSEEQATVDAATLQLSTARAALVLNKLVSANTIGNVTVGENANVKVVANGSPKTIRLVADGSTLTFERADATITQDGDNEIWNISVPVAAESTDYDVFAKYGVEFGNDSVALNITATQGLDLSIHSVSIPDKIGSKIYAGRHDVIVRTSLDVYKVQFVDWNGNTVTYDKRSNPVVDGDELVWTLNFNFCSLGNYEYSFRTRAENSTFAYTGEKITGRVMYYA